MRCYNVFLILLFMFLPRSTEAIRWLALHESEGNWTGQDCTEARREGALGGGQARACRRQPAAMPHVAAAARLARDACKAAHAGDRWNCSSVDLAPNYSPDLLTAQRVRAAAGAGRDKRAGGALTRDPLMRRVIALALAAAIVQRPEDARAGSIKIRLLVIKKKGFLSCE
ncbi:protein Wnt-11b-2-like [Choristoneura fumiferana]|uniref:protein Wnt-11b-2-like n=1 Tax=Choristoneura fumiferana TaxID=7141 RepID=UPI003D153F83